MRKKMVEDVYDKIKTTCGRERNWGCVWVWHTTAGADYIYDGTADREGISTPDYPALLQHSLVEEGKDEGSLD